MLGKGSEDRHTVVTPHWNAILCAVGITDRAAIKCTVDGAVDTTIRRAKLGSDAAAHRHKASNSTANARAVGAADIASDARTIQRPHG